MQSTVSGQSIFNEIRNSHKFIVIFVLLWSSNFLQILWSAQTSKRTFFPMNWISQKMPTDKMPNIFLSTCLLTEIYGFKLLNKLSQELLLLAREELSSSKLRRKKWERDRILILSYFWNKCKTSFEVHSKVCPLACFIPPDFSQRILLGCNSWESMKWKDAGV